MSLFQKTPIFLLAMGITTVLSLLIVNTVFAQTPTPYPSYASGDFFLPPYLSDSERMGYGKSSSHNTTPLNAGWYLDWGAASPPAHPNGAEYVRTIYLHTHDTGTICGSRKAPATMLSQITPSITGTTLINRVQAEPGALWAIGNEPDSIYNGSPIQAELYAELYHYFYTTIKTADPTAKIAIGAIVQPSTLRMEYLDKALTHYQTLYGTPMPVDVWNIHLYRLNEGPCGTWGAAVPPFSSSNYGWSIGFSAAELLNVDKLELALRDFRQWMSDRGYADIPLIITEMGVLPPPSFAGFDNNTAAQFLSDSFNMLLTAIDPVTGLAADGNRLMQAWAWYSTRDTVYNYGGNLFNDDGSLTVIGDAFAAQTAAHFSPYVDLQPIPPTQAITTTSTLTVTAYLQNRGNIAANNASVQVDLVNPNNGDLLAHKILSIDEIPKRYAAPPLLIQHQWILTDTPEITITVPYSINVTIISDDDNNTNNTLSFTTAWRPLVDLSIKNIQLSGGNTFLFDQPVTSVLSITVANRGGMTASETQLHLNANTATGTAMFGGVISFDVPSLTTQSQTVFTTEITIQTKGLFTVSATLDDVSHEQYMENNSLTKRMLAATSQIYLPLILR